MNYENFDFFEIENIRSALSDMKVKNFHIWLLTQIKPNEPILQRNCDFEFWFQSFYFPFTCFILNHVCFLNNCLLLRTQAFLTFKVSLEIPYVVFVPFAVTKFSSLCKFMLSPSFLYNFCPQAMLSSINKLYPLKIILK